MADSKTTDPRVSALPEWLRLQGRTNPEMDPAEAEWCSMMNAAAMEIERLRAWMHYIEGNFRDGRECAAEALRGDAPPEGFAP